MKKIITCVIILILGIYLGGIFLRFSRAGFFDPDPAPTDNVFVIKLQTKDGLTGIIRKFNDGTTTCYYAVNETGFAPAIALSCLYK